MPAAHDPREYVVSRAKVVTWAANRVVGRHGFAVAIVGAVAAGLALAGPSAAVSALSRWTPTSRLPVIPGVPYLDPAIPVPGIPGTPIQAPIGVPKLLRSVTQSVCG